MNIVRKPILPEDMEIDMKPLLSNPEPVEMKPDCGIFTGSVSGIFKYVQKEGTGALPSHNDKVVH